MDSRVGASGLRAHSVREEASGYYAGQAALSRMGFPVPLCSASLGPAPLILIPWQLGDSPAPAVQPSPAATAMLSRSGGYVARIQTSQGGLFDADHWFNATDITVPSIIYRDFIPHNNPLAYAFALHPRERGGAVFALQSMLDGKWVRRDPVCDRLITVPQLDDQCWFVLGPSSGLL